MFCRVHSNITAITGSFAKAMLRISFACTLLGQCSEPCSVPRSQHLSHSSPLSPESPPTGATGGGRITVGERRASRPTLLWNSSTGHQRAILGVGLLHHCCTGLSSDTVAGCQIKHPNHGDVRGCHLTSAASAADRTYCGRNVNEALGKSPVPSLLCAFAMGLGFERWDRGT